MRLNAHTDIRSDSYLTIQSSVELLTANAEDKIRSVKFTAYTGGAVKIPQLFFPVVFDLVGIEKVSNIPLLFNHDLNVVVGHTTEVNVNANGIDGRGMLSGSNDKVREIIANADNGFPWLLSVGLQNSKLVFYGADEKFTANGQTFFGPKYHATNNVLREISITSVGADSRTSLQLAASFLESRGSTMFEQWLASLGMDAATISSGLKASMQKAYDDMQKKLDSVKTLEKKPEEKKPELETVDSIKELRAKYTEEMKRVEAIRVLSAKYGEPKDKAGNLISITAISDNWTEERTHLEMLQASRPTNVQFITGRSVDKYDNSVLEAALVQSIKKLPNVEKLYPEQTLEIAHKRFRGRASLQEIILEAAYANGYDERTFRISVGNVERVLRAAFSTTAISGILSNVANKYMVRGFESVDSAWRMIANITSRPDFKEATGYRGVGSFTFEPLPPTGQIPHGTMSEAEYGNRVKTHAKMFTMTREHIVNDDLGILEMIPRGIGRGGAIALNREFWTAFLAGVAANFWSVANNNVSEGELTISGLDALNAVFRKQVDENGDFTLSKLAILLVPVELEPTANVLMSSQKIVTGVDDTLPENNPWAGKMRPVSSPYLSDDTITGSSNVAYYGLADPQDIPTIEVAFLDGVETPTVESADADFNVLGVQFRGYYDFGVRLQEFRGSVRSTGEPPSA